MASIHHDPAGNGADLRSHLYNGDLIVLSRLTAVQKFVDFAREQLAECFAPHDPEQAHAHFSPEELAAILGSFKPRFIHHDTSKALVREIAAEAGFDPQTTYFDVPKPRTAYPQGHLTTGIAYAFPWHRDTWYSAPVQQINWWMPIFDVRADNAMKFDLKSFNAAVENDSSTFDFYQSNKDRLSAAKQVGTDTRSRPGARTHTSPSEVVILPRPGSIMLFSGAQLHATIPNTSGISRYSIDFRTIDRTDVERSVGAPKVDVACSGSALREFLAVTDGSPLPEELIASVEGAPPPDDAILVFDKNQAAKAAQNAGALND
jgi:hypothetical protein